jgi:hypothetical protein
MATPYYYAAALAFCAATITACGPAKSPPDAAPVAPPANPQQAAAAGPWSTLGLRPNPDLHIISDYEMKPENRGKDPVSRLEVKMVIPLTTLTEGKRATLESNIRNHAGALVVSSLAAEMTQMENENPMGVALVKAALRCTDLERSSSPTTCILATTGRVATTGFRPNVDLHVVRDYEMKQPPGDVEPVPTLEVSMILSLDKLTPDQRKELEKNIKERHGTLVLQNLKDEIAIVAQNPSALAFVKAALGCTDLTQPISATSCTQ